MARKGASPKDPIPPRRAIVGTYLAFDDAGEVVWQREDFRAGHDTIPFGLSVTMKAMRIVDPKSGETLAKWDPWAVL